MANGYDSDRWAWLKGVAVICAFAAAIGLLLFRPSVSERKAEPAIEETRIGQWRYALKSDGSLEASLLDRTDPTIPTAVYKWRTSWMRMTLLENSGNTAQIQAVSLSGGRLRLTGVLPGVNVEYYPTKYGIKDDIIILSRDAAAASADGLSFSYALKFLGVQPAKKADGSFEPYVFKAGGKYAFHIAEPVMIDAEGRTTKDIAASMRRTKSTDPWFDSEADPYAQFTLTITPSQKWLLNEYRSYPVRIDPTVIRDEVAAVR